MVMVNLDFTLLVTPSLSPGTMKAACILLDQGVTWAFYWSVSVTDISKSHILTPPPTPSDS